MKKDKPEYHLYRNDGLLLYTAHNCENPREAIVLAKRDGISFRDLDATCLDLRAVNFTGCDLRGARFRSSWLHGAFLKGARVYGTYWPAPTMVLMANWGRCSDSLTRSLMRYDADNHPDPKAFFRYGKDATCPYAGQVYVNRAAQFYAKAELINRNFLRLKVYTAYELMQMLLKEHCNLEP